MKRIPNNEKNAGEAVLGPRKRGRIFSSGASGACGTSGVEFSLGFLSGKGARKNVHFLVNLARGPVQEGLKR